MDIKIHRAKKSDLAYIQEKLKNYLLDFTKIDWRQFFVARWQDKVIAFGRIIDHGEFFEIASLGVDYYHRRKGLGRKMLAFLVRKAKNTDGQKPIYGVTHVERFVVSCGFMLVKDNYPAYLDHKRKYICHLGQSRISVVKWNGEST